MTASSGSSSAACGTDGRAPRHPRVDAPHWMAGEPRLRPGLRGAAAQAVIQQHIRTRSPASFLEDVSSRRRGHVSAGDCGLLSMASPPPRQIRRRLPLRPASPPAGAGPPLSPPGAERPGRGGSLRVQSRRVNAPVAHTPSSAAGRLRGRDQGLGLMPDSSGSSPTFRRPARGGATNRWTSRRPADVATMCAHQAMPPALALGDARMAVPARAESRTRPR
jgi:hypothetical protein